MQRLPAVPFAVVSYSCIDARKVQYGIVPAVGAILSSDKVFGRLSLGWVYGIIASIAGIGMSDYFDLPTLCKN
jgi:hypothetical protein